jgi:uncharacterized membrane protein YdjX (TVP38/TMEM64 family)
VTVALIGSGFWRTLLIITLIRVPPSSPFALTNLVLGVTRVNRAAYVLGTALGVAPRTAALVFLAVGVQQLSSRGPDEPYWLWVVGIVLTVVVLLVIGAIANRAVARVTGPGADGQATAATTNEQTAEPPSSG